MNFSELGCKRNERNGREEKRRQIIRKKQKSTLRILFVVQEKNEIIRSEAIIKKRITENY